MILDRVTQGERAMEGGNHRPPFPEVTVVLGDPNLPDATKVHQRYSREDLEAVDRMKAALGELEEYRFSYLDNHEALVAELMAHRPAFVLNLCDTGFRNDANRELHVPALLEILEIPYSGAGPAAMAICYDKALVRAAASAEGIPVPREIFIDRNGEIERSAEFFPILIKPNIGDGSVGITAASVTRNIEEAVACVERLRAEWPGRDVLMQEFLPGTEYGVALIGNPGSSFQALSLMEVDYSGLEPGLPPVLSYESKTVPGSPFWSQIKYHEARLGDEGRRRLVAYSMALFKRLGCRDYARFDFRTDAGGEIRLLEVNANPAWCWDGKLNFMAGFAGHSYPALLRMILRTAEARVVRERKDKQNRQSSPDG